MHSLRDLLTGVELLENTMKTLDEQVKTLTHNADQMLVLPEEYELLIGKLSEDTLVLSKEFQKLSKMLHCELLPQSASFDRAELDELLCRYTRIAKLITKSGSALQSLVARELSTNENSHSA